LRRSQPLLQLAALPPQGGEASAIEEHGPRAKPGRRAFRRQQDLWPGLLSCQAASGQVPICCASAHRALGRWRRGQLPPRRQLSSRCSRRLRARDLAPIRQPPVSSSSPHPLRGHRVDQVRDGPGSRSRVSSPQARNRVRGQTDPRQQRQRSSRKIGLAQPPPAIWPGLEASGWGRAREGAGRSLAGPGALGESSRDRSASRLPPTCRASIDAPAFKPAWRSTAWRQHTALPPWRRLRSGRGQWLPPEPPDSQVGPRGQAPKQPIAPARHQGRAGGRDRPTGRARRSVAHQHQRRGRRLRAQADAPAHSHPEWSDPVGAGGMCICVDATGSTVQGLSRGERQTWWTIFRRPPDFQPIEPRSMFQVTTFPRPRWVVEWDVAGLP